MRVISGFVLSVLIAAPLRLAVAQVKTGELTTDLSGTVSAGYTADYGNLTSSDHGITAGGTASLSGSYYNPNFFSFDIDPFLNQSRTNSDFQSITNASGINATASIFSGSNFPGTVSYANTYNGEGNYGIPGVGNYTSHGNSDVLSIGWSEHVPKVPALTFGYQSGSSQYSIYGTDANSNSDFHSFVVGSTYSLAGFNFNGGYHYSVVNSLLPQFDFANQPEKSNSDTTGYSAGISHLLPFHGTFSIGGTRSDLDYTSTEGSYKGTLDNAFTGVIFNPVERLTFGANAQYIDNLTGELYQAIVAAGGVATGTLPMEASHALDLTAFAAYLVPAWHMTFNGTEQHEHQDFEGEALGSDSFTGTATYSNTIKGGVLNVTAGGVRSAISPSDLKRIGFIGALNYMHEVKRWQVSGMTNYSGDQQTLLASYLTNTWGYSGNASRRFSKRIVWTNVASGSKAWLTSQQGSTSFSQSYSSSLLYHWIDGSAGYSRSTGNAILTSSGLVATPIPLPVLTPTAVVLYGGDAYTMTLGANPRHGLTLSAAYSIAHTNTANGSANSNNDTSQLTARVQYLVRKVWFQAGYARLVQSFSASNTPPSMLGSFYFGLTRWFNFF